jgi:uracil-DNA glycosylase
VLQAASTASILIAGQAPGKKVDRSGIPFDDASGDRLRLWLSIDKDVFHDANTIAILPMGFCYPGSGGSGDLPPRPECAQAWRTRLLQHMPHLQLALLIGQYAQDWHLQGRGKATLTETVRAWRDYWPDIVPLPHPSPRNNIWLSRNRWFEEEVLPPLKAQVKALLANTRS